MSILIVAEGNVGRCELKKIRVGEEDQSVLNMSVKFSANKRGKNGDWEDRGFWASVELWGKRAELTAPLIGVGARVLVMGEQWMEVYESTVQETLGQQMTRVKVRASSIGLSPFGIKSVVREERKKRVNESGSEADDPGMAEDWPESAFDDDIPF